jgi:hypothetical protein
VIFRENLARPRNGNSPENVAIIRHCALNFLSQARPTTGLKPLQTRRMKYCLPHLRPQAGRLMLKRFAWIGHFGRPIGAPCCQKLLVGLISHPLADPHRHAGPEREPGESAMVIPGWQESHRLFQ